MKIPPMIEKIRSIIYNTNNIPQKWMGGAKYMVGWPAGRLHFQQNGPPGSFQAARPVTLFLEKSGRPAGQQTMYLAFPIHLRIYYWWWYIIGYIFFIMRGIFCIMDGIFPIIGVGSPFWVWILVVCENCTLDTRALWVSACVRPWTSWTPERNFDLVIVSYTLLAAMVFLPASSNASSKVIQRKRRTVSP